ncbi:MAG: hypothetical protein AAF491_10655 [Verrucomicrobiota bacterium]
MARPSKTFLVEAGDEHFRVDLTRDAAGYTVGKVYWESSEEKSSGTAPEGFDAFDPMGGPYDTSWIPSLLKQRPKAASEVTLLSDRLTSVVAEIPVSPGEDWRSSAEMEAQTISGLSTSESIAASTRLPGDSGMMWVWVTQVAMRDVAAMRSAVSSVPGSRLVSAGHPAGIRLDATAPQLESWTNFALFHVAGGERIELRGWNGPDALGEAQENGEVAAALLKGEKSSLLLLGTSDSEPPSEEVATVVSLSEEAGIDRWAAGLARACDPLTGHVLGLPLINVPKPPPSPKTLALTATAIAAGVILLLVGHYFLNRFNKSNLQADLVKLEEPAKRVTSAKTRISALRRELQELTDKEADSGASDVNVYAHRRRIGALLEGISVGSTVNGVVVLEFRPDKLDTVLTGAASTFRAPQTLARKIDEALSDNGWRASLVRRTAQLLRDDGGPWSYEIRLTPGRPVSVDAPLGNEDRGSSASAPSPSGSENNVTTISF